MKPRILFVDDDPLILAAFERNLRNQFSLDTASSGPEALARLEGGAHYAVVMADMRMPVMNGVELLERVRALVPDTVRLMLTGNADQQTAIDAINRGHIFRFLNKPVEPEALHLALTDALRQHELIRAELELLEGTLSGSVKLLTDVLAMVAPSALGRGQRLRDSMLPFARTLNAEPLWELELGALLSSLGCAAVPPSLLHKIAADLPLTVEEAAIRRRIPEIGHDMLATIPRLERVADIVRFQSKHFDGAGFPVDARVGHDIPLGARMLKILIDRLELESDGIIKRQAFDVMQNRLGFYDPELLVQCFTCFGTFLVNPLSHDLPILALSAIALVPGQVVVSDIVSNSGLLLVGSGHRLTSPVIERIRNNVVLGEVRSPFMVQDPGHPESAPASAPITAFSHN
jgi:response regulator RpfG family c-di-GMP phosphodiesterase